MMSISEFALASGLSPKTLRFYDEREILIPAEVDPRSGYRRYSASQLRDATTIRILRATGMPLEAVSRALAEPDEQQRLLQTHRSHLDAERSLQDRALDLAENLLPHLESGTEIRTREGGATNWVAVPLMVPLDPNEAGDRLTGSVDATIERLYAALVAGGNPPTGNSWTAMPTEITGTSAEILLCFPVATRVPESFTLEGADLRSGTLPARTEAYVQVTASEIAADLLDDLPDGRLPDPVFIEFSEYLEQHSTRPTEIRQASWGTGPEDWTVEYSATVTEQ
ncbi:MAG TPA: MerR family transcriptional regulator [Actinomycetales bacterium]|nr:MerR family transcriptional regulator [Actinomycetales bacterium]